MPIVRFTQVVIADFVDPKTGRPHSHLVALDREGRIWESFADDGGTLKLVPSPVIPGAKRKRRNA